MEEIIKSINAWEYIAELPTQLLNFEFSLLKKQEDEIYYIFSYKHHGLKSFYQGGIASAVATMVGHYPWFLTNNYLEYYWKRYSFRE